MMVGHAMLAFAFVASAAAAVGYGRERALALGVAAAAFAAVPDVDMVYAVLGATQAQVVDAWAVTEAFWRFSQAVHRSITHSLVVAVPAALAFAWSAGTVGRGEVAGRGTGPSGSHRGLSGRQALALAVLAGLVVVAFLESGPLGAAVMTVFAVVGVAVAGIARRRAGLSGRELFAAGLVGLLSHPFGDLFTGSPPEFLYPFDAVLVGGRVALAGDPTLNLVAIFGVELATIWLAAVAFCRLSGRRPREFVDARATVGVAYGVAALVLPAPTLSVSYHFVFSVLAVGTVGMAPRGVPLDRLRRGTKSRSLLARPDAGDCLRGALTGLGAVTLGVAAYAVGYLASQGFF